MDFIGMSGKQFRAPARATRSTTCASARVGAGLRGSRTREGTRFRLSDYRGSGRRVRLLGLSS
jgi:hypothetical protein